MAATEIPEWPRDTFRGPRVKGGGLKVLTDALEVPRLVDVFVSHTIHGTNGIYLHENHNKQSHVGKHTSPMHCMGLERFIYST